MALIAFIVSFVAVTTGPTEGRTCTISGTVEFLKPLKSEVTLNQLVVFVSEKPFKVERDPWRSFAIEQKDRQFRPRVTIVQLDDELTFPNKDDERHAVNAEELFNIQPNTMRVPEPQTVARSGPIRLRCELHDWMRADVLVIPVRRFHARVGSDGTWHLTDLPNQSLSIRAWEPNGGMTNEVKVDPCSAGNHLVLKGKNPPAPARRGYSTDN